jgi:hypothetical protein
VYSQASLLRRRSGSERIKVRASPNVVSDLPSLSSIGAANLRVQGMRQRIRFPKPGQTICSALRARIIISSTSVRDARPAAASFNNSAT